VPPEGCGWSQARRAPICCWPKSAHGSGDQLARHFLDLEHARTLDTDHLLLARRAIRDANAANAMAVVHGEAGLGKTFAVETALDENARPVLWATFPSKPTPRLIAATLLELLTGRPTRLDRFRAISRLVELLADRDRLIVIDESQLLNGDCIELLRYVHDQPTTRFALVLVGGNGTWRVLSAEPMLASRIFRRVRFQPLTRTEVLGQLPSYHPLFAGVDPELLGWIDDVFAHGNLRHWAAFTLSATALAQEAGRPGVDEQIARNVFALHAGGPNR
jgi:hypothetical protein